MEIGSRSNLGSALSATNRIVYE
jgi:hypothetical protein